MKKQPHRLATEPSLQELFMKLSPAGRRAFFDRLLADDFLAFLRKVFETVSPERVFRETWLVEAMINRAEGVMGGKTKRLIVTVPPRHLKSIVFSVALPAFFLGRDPTKRIICVSYSNELAIKHAIDFRAVVTSPWYQRAFPKSDRQYPQARRCGIHRRKRRWPGCAAPQTATQKRLESARAVKGHRQSREAVRAHHWWLLFYETKPNSLFNPIAFAVSVLFCANQFPVHLR